MPLSSAEKKHIDEIFESQKNYKKNLRTSTASERIAKLERLRVAIEDSKAELYQAVYTDFKKPKAEAETTEVVATVAEIGFAKKYLHQWMRPRPVDSSMVIMGARSELRYEPKGQSLIIAPWNYPVHLSLAPLVGAIAAGNTVILKPSELAPATADYLQRLIEKVFISKEVAVIQGEADTASYLLDKPHDHIFFTGSTAVGKIVMQKAAQHLSTVTLELGGKSPVIIDKNCDIRQAAKKIIWGKYLNYGQTCVAPDYVLLPHQLKDKFIEACNEVLAEFYGKSEGSRKNSPDLARIINLKHFKRIKGLLDDAIKKGARVKIGGDSSEKDLYIAPTLVTDVDPESSLMQQEIFGPVLPVLGYNTLDDAIEFVNNRAKPLALYIFTNSERVADRIVDETSAGGTCINDVILQLVNPHLPFGGTGESGQGNYHGFYSFKAFSHERAVVRQNRLMNVSQVTYPPYGGVKEVLVDVLKRFM